MEYDAGNTNGKMNAGTYINILSKLQKEILGKELILWQDRDSAHLSKKVIDWMDKHGMDHIEGPPTSPDLSIMETWVKLLRQMFYQRRVASGHAGVKRFYQVWHKLKPEKINSTIDCYPKRLHDCIKVTEGRATKYWVYIEL